MSRLSSKWIEKFKSFYIYKQNIFKTLFDIQNNVVVMLIWLPDEILSIGYINFSIKAVFDGFWRIMDRLQVHAYCVILSVFRVYLVTISKALQYPSRLPHDSKLIYILSFPSSFSSLFLDARHWRAASSDYICSVIIVYHLVL